MYQQNNSAQNATSIDLHKLELPYKVSSIMDFHSPAVAIVGSSMFVGFLADDTHCQNPLDDCDGMGKIYSAHRHSTTHAEMQEALALDSNWDKNLDLVDEHSGLLRRAWIAAAKQSPEFQLWAERTAGRGAALDVAYYERRAKKLWRDTDGEYIYNQDCIFDFDFTNEVRSEVWKQLRSERLIGDPDYVLLDCYSHGGEAWSISGQGMQCRWDTACGAGVWVPDDSAREEIDRRAPVYAFGCVKNNGSWTRGSGRKRYYAQVDEQFGSFMSPQFNEWHEAFEWLSTKSAGIKQPIRKADLKAHTLKGRLRAASELANSTLQDYNDWLSGSNYGVIIAEFQNVGSTENPIWNLLDSDDCWGYIGDSYAMEEAVSAVEHKVKALTTKAA